MEPFRYKAFISYSWADRQWGEWLHHALETYRAPKGVADGRTLHPIFKDREEEAAGHSIGAAIETAMGNSEFLVVLCSPNAAKSQWVNREIAWFKTHRDPHKILTVIVGGEPMASAIAGRAAEECFPKTLLYNVGADLQPTTEMGEAPLAADARETGDGKRAAKLKLAAAMLGLGYDALARRDDKRRSQRRRLIYAGLAALSVVLGGLSIFAFNQRDAARLAQKEAEFQKEEAQGLVEFMLTDLRQRLDAVGRLDILETVATRLDESYAKQELAKLDANALGRRARVQLLLGEVDNTRGDLDNALARYKAAAATTEELLKRNPKSAQQIFDHAQSVFWVGYIAWQRGEANEAKKYFTQYHDYAQALVAIDPENEDYLAEVDYANSNLGTLALDQGEAAEAEEYFSRSLARALEIAQRFPNDQQHQLSLAESYSWLASARERRGAFGRAEESLSAVLKLLNSILTSDPTNSIAIGRRQVNARMRARVALSRGDAEAAIVELDALIEEQRKVLAKDEANTTWLDYYNGAQLDLGATLLAIGRIADADGVAKEALDVATRLRAIDASVSSWKMFNHANALQLKARIALAKNDAKAASAAIGQLEQVLESDRLAIATLSEKIRRGEIELLKAQTFATANDNSGSQQAARRALDMLSPIDAKLAPFQQRLLAEAHLLGGEPDNAAIVARKLQALNYRHPEFIALLEEFPALKATENAAPR